MTRPLVRAAVCCILVGSGTALAGDFNFGAFGTFGVTHSSEENADFVRNYATQARGAGASDRWSFRTDSVVGAQLDFRAADRWSAVVQAVVEQNTEGDFRPRVEWAYLQFALTPDLSIRLGRTALPMFMDTDVRRIGYSQTPVRSPPELYSLLPLSTNDGVDVRGRLRFGSVTHDLQGSFGGSDFHYASPMGSDVAKVRRQVSASDSMEWGSWTLRANLGGGRLTLPIYDLLLNPFQALGPAGFPVAERYSFRERTMHFRGAGLRYDPGSWFAGGEWGQVTGHPLWGNYSAHYALAGARFGEWTPYGLLGATHYSQQTAAGVNLSLLPAGLQPIGAFLNAALAGQVEMPRGQSSIGAGVRWDFHRSMDLKLQVDRIDLDRGASGALVGLRPGFVPGGSFTVVTATLDFVF